MIAQKNYGSGYNAVDIAKVNKLKNPNIIEIGMKLILPEVKANTPTTGIIAEAQTGKVTISEKEYKIKVGDTLWNIAVRAYGDGYQWMKIAQANKLTNPDVIHKDNILSLPRLDLTSVLQSDGSSTAERLLPKEKVEGSIPFHRSRIYFFLSYQIIKPMYKLSYIIGKQTL